MASRLANWLVSPTADIMHEHVATIQTGPGAWLSLYNMIVFFRRKHTALCSACPARASEVTGIQCTIGQEEGLVETSEVAGSKSRQHDTQPLGGAQHWQLGDLSKCGAAELQTWMFAVTGLQEKPFPEAHGALPPGHVAYIML